MFNITFQSFSGVWSPFLRGFSSPPQPPPHEMDVVATWISPAFKNISATQVLIGSVALFYLYDLFENGLANFLCLETLLHGTGPQNYFKIRREGLQPKCGGKENGSSFYSGSITFIKTSKNYVHVFKDSELSTYLPVRLCAKVHAFLSGKQLYHTLPSPVLGIADLVNACVAFLIMPTLKFRFQPAEVFKSSSSKNLSLIQKLTNKFKFLFTSSTKQHLFENDPFYFGMAYRTKRNISRDRIGLRGTIKYGFNSKVFERIKANPSKSLKGMMQMITSITLSALSYIAISTENSLFSDIQNLYESNPRICVLRLTTLMSALLIFKNL